MDQAEIEHIEKELGFQLPSVYTTFMLSQGEILKEDAATYDRRLELTAYGVSVQTAIARHNIEHADEFPKWWKDFFVIGDDGGGGYYLMKRDGSPQVWLQEPGWDMEPTEYCPSLQAFVDDIRGD